ncbi:MAG: hypothetical protein ACOX83_10065 [Candidatus Spyradocola sp.]|jgi:hypothetical protein
MERMQREAGPEAVEAAGTQDLKALEAFLAQRGLSAQGALRLLESALRRQEDLRARALETVSAIRAIDDPRFTVETLRAHPEALRALEDGMSVGKVYRRYFLRGGDGAEQTEANLGLGPLRGERLTAEEIERISRMVDRGGRYDLD